MNAKFIPSANRKCRTRMMKSADLLNTRHPDDRNVYATNIRTTNIIQHTRTYYNKLTLYSKHATTKKGKPEIKTQPVTLGTKISKCSNKISLPRKLFFLRFVFIKSFSFISSMK